jgi:hypothetical protein
MSNPRVKRPFAGNAADPAQRQITSFFGPRSSSSADVDAEVRSPPLPASVQSGLMTVGMRVRKAMSDHNDKKLLADAILASPVPSRSRAPKGASRELMPFCGINKVGGLGFQAEVREDEEEDEPLPGLDDIPGLTMSQESTDSTVSVKGARKRSLDGEAGDSIQPWLSGTSLPSADGALSPRGGLAPMNWGNARVMAVPRSRLARKESYKSEGHDFDQENMAIDQDFGDADFLVYADAREMDTTG